MSAILGFFFLYMAYISPPKKKGNACHIWRKSPLMALISEYLAADLAADLSADASADALCIINIGRWPYYPFRLVKDKQTI